MLKHYVGTGMHSWGEERGLGCRKQRVCALAHLVKHYSAPPWRYAVRVGRLWGGSWASSELVRGTEAGAGQGEEGPGPWIRVRS